MLKRVLSIIAPVLTVAVALAGFLNCDTYAATASVFANDWAELSIAVASAPTDGTVLEISLKNDILVPGGGGTNDTLSIPASTHVILTGGKTLTGFSGKNTVTINAGGHLELRDITITHVAGQLGRGIMNSGGTLDINNGATISGNTTKFTNGMGAGIYGGANSTIRMYGGVISNNSSQGNYLSGAGGGVCFGGANSTFTMYAGAIVENDAKQNGGGVTIGSPDSGYSGGHFVMKGGTIAKNTGSGVSLYNKDAQFEMNGGVISENSGDFGGGVEIVYGTAGPRIFTMNDGVILGNTARTQGGGIGSGPARYLGDHKVIINNGLLSGNSALDGGGIYVSPATVANIAQATIADNIASNTAGGIFAADSTTVTVSRSTIFQSNTDSLSAIDSDVNWSTDKIYYNSNDGTDRQFRTLFLDEGSGSTGSVSAQKFVREGYTLMYWSKSADGTDGSFNTGDSLDMDAELYAIWELTPEAPSAGVADSSDELHGAISGYPTIALFVSIVVLLLIILLTRKTLGPRW